MKKLTKKHLEDRDKIHKAIEDAKDNVNDAITDFNASVDAAYSKYEEAVGKLNFSLEEAREFIQELVEEQQTYYDEKSEKWQESEAGGRYSSWKDDIESISDDLEEVELADRPEIEECEVDIDRLFNLPELNQD